MAFLHMWRKERQGKSGEVGSHARASLYMVEHWERNLYIVEVVRNWETHVGHSAVDKMIKWQVKSQGPTCPAVTRCQITHPYVCSSLLPRLHTSLSNRLGRTAPPTTQEKPRPRLLNSIQYTNFVSMDCAMEQSLKKMAVHMYTT